MPMTLRLSESTSVLLAVNAELLEPVPQGLTRKILLGPMVWPETALMALPPNVIRSLLVLPAAPVEENTQEPGPSAGCVVVTLAVLVKVYCALGELLTCSKVAQSISGCPSVLPTTWIPTKASCVVLVPLSTDW